VQKRLKIKVFTDNMADAASANKWVYAVGDAKAHARSGRKNLPATSRRRAHLRRHYPRHRGAVRWNGRAIPDREPKPAIRDVPSPCSLILTARPREGEAAPSAAPQATIAPCA